MATLIHRCKGRFHDRLVAKCCFQMGIALVTATSVMFVHLHHQLTSHLVWVHHHHHLRPAVWFHNCPGAQRLTRPVLVIPCSIPLLPVICSRIQTNHQLSRLNPVGIQQVLLVCHQLRPQSLCVWVSFLAALPNPSSFSREMWPGQDGMLFSVSGQRSLVFRFCFL